MLGAGAEAGSSGVAASTLSDAFGAALEPGSGGELNTGKRRAGWVSLALAYVNFIAFSYVASYIVSLVYIAEDVIIIIELL